jgi:hypothetical protein
MEDILEIKCLSPEEKKKVLEQIEQAIAEKVAAGLLKEREVREIEEMKLRPPLDIQDVQSVYEDFMYRDKGKQGVS